MSESERQHVQARVRAAVDAQEVGRIYSRLAFQQALLDIEAPKVAAAYRLLANEAKVQVGGQMKTVWQKPVRTEDAEMNLDEHYDRSPVDHARDHCVATMRAVLRHGRVPAAPKSLLHKGPACTESGVSKAHDLREGPA
ncbi:hypothetical protein [Amycolatopsis xylanica]|nr:hypothetical protein [Amycolatopsis xylanica]